MTDLELREKAIKIVFDNCQAADIKQIISAAELVYNYLKKARKN